MSSSLKPTCRRLDTARSVHFEAQTPFRAFCHCVSAARGAPRVDMALHTALSSFSGRTSSSTTSFRTSGHFSSSTSSSSCSRTSSFSGSSSTFSKMPNGTVALGGTAYSPPLGFSSERWKDFPPRLLPFLRNSEMDRTRDGGAGGFFTTIFLPAAAEAPPASAAPSSSRAAAHVTSPLGPTESDILLPALPLSSCRRASSSQLARRTFWLRARIATWERTSTAWAAGRSTATIPAGMSSQPVSVSVTATHGPLPAGSSAGNAFIASTVPTTRSRPALTSSQGPRPAPRRSWGCRPRRHWARRRSERQRAVSSPKASRVFGSGENTAPGRSPPAFRRDAQVCSSSATRSHAPAHTMLSRSHAESMSWHQCLLHRSWPALSPSVIRR
mmetsp:Transcript_13332/g.36624  ORF Transcript_13332/g.36624 Transcript_13332/m.36624 type:complete len:385 (+) Transcript_13332:863-2017(+)